MHRKLFGLAVLIILSMACSLLLPSVASTSTPALGETTAGATAQASSPAAGTGTAITSSTATPAGQIQFIAYISDGELLVTDVTNGIVGGTTQYTAVESISNKVSEITWSPSGEMVAFVSAATGEPHIMYVYAGGASTPTDLGVGSSPAWSPDSRLIAYIGGTNPDQNIWITGVDNPSPHQVTFEKNHAWGRPVFTPDGQALVVSTADHFDMGAQGNTSFTFERLALDGRGARTALPGATPLEGVRLPYDVQMSPDQTRFAFSTSGHVSACASLGSYYVSDFNGNRQQLTSLSLRAANDPANERYLVGLSYGWSPKSDALIATGSVVDCDPNSPTMGQTIAGPQLSILRLDGSEGTIIPGLFYYPSMDRSETMIAAAHYQNPQDSNPTVELYSAATGKLIATLGPGTGPQFQP